jgi:hypothetical protein
MGNTAVATAFPHTGEIPRWHTDYRPIETVARQDRVHLVRALGKVGLEVSLGKCEPGDLHDLALRDCAGEVVFEPCLGYDAHEQGLELGAGFRALALLDEGLEGQHRIPHASELGWLSRNVGRSVGWPAGSIAQKKASILHLRQSMRRDFAITTPPSV